MEQGILGLVSTVQAFEQVGMLECGQSASQSVCLASSRGFREMLSCLPRPPILIPFLLILLFHYSLMRQEAAAAQPEAKRSQAATVVGGLGGESE